MLAIAHHSTDNPPKESAVSNAGLQREQVFQGLVKRTWQKAYWTAFDILGDAAEAEDLCQEALLRAYERWDEFRQQASPDTWVYRIVVNLCLNQRRRRGIWQRISQVLRVQTDDVANWNDARGLFDPEQQLRDQETIAAIQRAMGRLSEHQRTVFVLRYLQGFSLQETADITGMAVGTIKSHMFRALKTMRKQLSHLNPDGNRQCGS